MRCHAFLFKSSFSLRRFPDSDSSITGRWIESVLRTFMWWKSTEKTANLVLCLELDLDGVFVFLENSVTSRDPWAVDLATSGFVRNAITLLPRGEFSVFFAQKTISHALRIPTVPSIPILQGFSILPVSLLQNRKDISWIEATLFAFSPLSDKRDGKIVTSHHGGEKFSTDFRLHSNVSALLETFFEVGSC